MLIPKNVAFKVLLLQKGLSNTEAAELVDRSPAWVSLVIYGQARPTVEQIQIWARELEVSANELGLRPR